MVLGRLRITQEVLALRIESHPRDIWRSRILFTETIWRAYLIMGPQSWRWVFLDFPKHLILHSTCFSETKWQRHFSVWFPWHILEYSLDPAVSYIPQPRGNKDYEVAQGKRKQRQTLQIEPWTTGEGLFQHHRQLHSTASGMLCTILQARVLTPRWKTSPWAYSWEWGSPYIVCQSALLGSSIFTLWLFTSSFSQ